MKLRRCDRVFHALLFLSLAGWIFIVSASETPTAADVPYLEPSSADASTIGSTETTAAGSDSTIARATCTVTKTIERDRSGGAWWLHDGERRPTFCQRLWPEKGDPEGSRFTPPPGRWPWLVLLGRQKVAGPLNFGIPPPPGTETDLLSDPFCGGVLVGWGFVMTSARCLSGDLDASSERGAVAALLGDRTTALPNGTLSGPVRRVSHVLAHPTADLAMALLDVLYEGIPRWVRPACLPAAGATLTAGDPVDVASWSLPDAYYPRYVREAEMQVSDPERCREAYGDTHLFGNSTEGDTHLFGNGTVADEVLLVNGTNIDELLFVNEPDTENSAGVAPAVCVKPRGSWAAMANGGPLTEAWCSSEGGWPVVARRQDGRFEVVGVSTSGVGCGEGGRPPVFTSVAAHMDWVMDSLTPTDGPLPGMADGSGFSDMQQRTGDRHTAQRQYEGKDHPLYDDYANEFLHDQDYEQEYAHGEELGDELEQYLEEVVNPEKEHLYEQASQHGHEHEHVDEHEQEMLKINLKLEIGRLGLEPQIEKALKDVIKEGYEKNIDSLISGEIVIEPKYKRQPKREPEQAFRSESGTSEPEPEPEPDALAVAEPDVRPEREPKFETLPVSDLHPEPEPTPELGPAP